MNSEQGTYQNDIQQRKRQMKKLNLMRLAPFLFFFSSDFCAGVES